MGFCRAWSTSISQCFNCSTIVLSEFGAKHAKKGSRHALGTSFSEDTTTAKPGGRYALRTVSWSTLCKTKEAVGMH